MPPKLNPNPTIFDLKRMLGDLEAEMAVRSSAEESLRRQTVYLHLLQGTAIAANEAKTVEDGLRVSLEHICKILEWPVGHVYLVAEGSPPALVSSRIWRFDDPRGYDMFKERTENHPLQAGADLPGLVLESGAPHWAANIAASPASPRAITAWDAGLRSGFAFPVFLDKSIDAVLEFFADETLEADNGLLDTMTAVGVQLGHLLKRKEAEKKLEKYQAHLEEIVEERSIDLAHTVHELKNEVAQRAQAEEKIKVYALELRRSNKDLDDFAAIASHDLQEPLRKIISFGDQLRKHLPDLDPKNSDFLERMRKAAVRMQTFINDLLAYSRVTAKATPFSPLDLAEIVRDVTLDLETRIAQTQGKVDIGHLPVLEADPLQMRQLFQNLVGNALKFHRADAPPVVRLSSRPVPTAKWEIRVEDNGIGFDEKYLDRIFKPFERLHGKDSYEGTGIGLAICLKIVRRHGGDITAKSQPGAGTTFIITLPERQPDEEKPERIPLLGRPGGATPGTGEPLLVSGSNFFGNFKELKF